MGATLPVVGERFAGKYEIVRSIGSGGMGLVYEALHSKLKQRFAIKFLNPALVSPELVARFEREARAAARLKSPYVVRSYDVDCTPDGLHYMVMEFLEGNDLSDELKTRGSIPLPELVDWILQVCSAIGEAHSAGIIHRDLKPANVFLTPQDGERTAKVLDFGISKLMAMDETDASPLTQSSIGTPQYMSPEQLGNSLIDGRTDIWAIGIILYRLLTTRFPFHADNAAAYAVAVATAPPIPFDLLRPDLPVELAAIIMRALEKDPGARFATAEELGAALLPFGSGRLSAAPKSLPQERAPALRSGSNAALEGVTPNSGTPGTRPLTGRDAGTSAPTARPPARSSPSLGSAPSLASSASQRSSPSVRFVSSEPRQGGLEEVAQTGSGVSHGALSLQTARSGSRGRLLTGAGILAVAAVLFLWRIRPAGAPPAPPTNAVAVAPSNVNVPQPAPPSTGVDDVNRAEEIPPPSSTVAPLVASAHPAGPSPAVASHRTSNRHAPASTSLADAGADFIPVHL